MWKYHTTASRLSIAQATIGSSKPHPCLKPEFWYGIEKRRIPECVGCPTVDEIGSVEHLGVNGNRA